MNKLKSELVAVIATIVSSLLVLTVLLAFSWLIGYASFPNSVGEDTQLVRTLYGSFFMALAFIVISFIDKVKQTYKLARECFVKDVKKISEKEENSTEKTYPFH